VTNESSGVVNHVTVIIKQLFVV